MPSKKQVVGFRVLMYHSIESPAMGDKKNLFSIPLSRFKLHMAGLSRNKVEGLHKITKLKTLKKCCFGLTFDDGYLNNLTLAAPLLKKLNIPFTIFVATSFLDKKKSGMLSRNDLLTLVNQYGATIGSHGHNHRPFTNLTSRALKMDLVTSKSILEQTLSQEINIISYPYGKVNEKIIKIICEVGYKYGFSSDFGINQKIHNPYNLKRTDILSSDTLDIFNQKINGKYDFLYSIQKFKGL